MFSSLSFRRTGLDVKAGKNIRKDDKGLENFVDYWTDSGIYWKSYMVTIVDTFINGSYLWSYQLLVSDSEV